MYWTGVLRGRSGGGRAAMLAARGGHVWRLVGGGCDLGAAGEFLIAGRLFAEFAKAPHLLQDKIILLEFIH